MVSNRGSGLCHEVPRCYFCGDRAWCLRHSQLESYFLTFTLVTSSNTNNILTHVDLFRHNVLVLKKDKVLVLKKNNVLIVKKDNVLVLKKDNFETGQGLGCGEGQCLGVDQTMSWFRRRTMYWF